MNTMGERITYAIALRGLKQGEAAKEIGISPQYLSDITSGRKSCSSRLRVTIAQRLRVNYDWLVTGVGVIENTTMTPEEEDIATMVAQVFSNNQSDIKRILTMTVMKTSKDDLKAIDRFIEMYLEQKRKTEQ